MPEKLEDEIAAKLATLSPVIERFAESVRAAGAEVSARYVAALQRNLAELLRDPGVIDVQCNPDTPTGIIVTRTLTPQLDYLHIPAVPPSDGAQS